MYRVTNIGQYPVVIRDLNLHISGGKTVDLDDLFSPDTVRRSVDLKNLIDRKKLTAENREQKKVQEIVIVPQPVQSPNQDNKMLAELKSDLNEIKNLLKSGSRIVSDKIPEQEYDAETEKRITELQVINLSNGIDGSKKNFNNIGKSTSKTEDLSGLLGVLDSLDIKGD